MSYECVLEPVIYKFNIESIKEVVEEAATLELEYIKICRACREFMVCVYMHITLEPGSCRAELIGMSITVSSSTVIDERVHVLLNYAFVITGNTGKGTSVFYVMKGHSLGVYYLLCRGVSVEWGNYEPVDYEEVRAFVKE